MNYLLRMEPTPSALRQGRLVMAIVAVILGVLLALYVASGAPPDSGLIATSVATGAILVGDGIAYFGQPSLRRYRIGRVIGSVAIVAAFATLLIPSPPA